MCLPLLVFPCTIKSRGYLLAPAHPGGPGKRAVKRLWWSRPYAKKTISWILWIIYDGLTTVRLELLLRTLNGLYPGHPAPERCTILHFTGARDDGMAVASAGPYAPRARQITMPVPHHSVFTGRMSFLPPPHHGTPAKQLCGLGCQHAIFCHLILCEVAVALFVVIFCQSFFSHFTVMSSF